MANSYIEYRKSYQPMVPPAQGIYEVSATQKAPLGTRISFADGRVYRYASNGTTALVAGRPVKGEGLHDPNHAVNAAVAAGQYTVTLQTGSAATTLAEGFLLINDVDGEGIVYKIKSSAANATTTTYTDVVLYDPIATALTTSSEGGLYYNPYKAMTVCTAVGDSVIGVPPIAVTASTSTITYYFWLQTWGFAACYQSGTPVAGSMAFLAVSAAAGVTSNQSYPWPTTSTAGVSFTSCFIGRFASSVRVDTEYTPVFLMIAP